MINIGATRYKVFRATRMEASTAGRRPPTTASAPKGCTNVRELEQSNQFDLVLSIHLQCSLADAALVAEHCDGLMLLVSLNRVDRSLPKEAIARIRSSGAPLLGLITNALKPEKQNGSYGYGYGKTGYGRYSYGG